MNEPVNNYSYKKLMFYPAQKRYRQEESSFSVHAKFPFSYTNKISQKKKKGGSNKNFLNLIIVSGHFWTSKESNYEQCCELVLLS